ncbi:MAG: GHKL domain-containing protein [Candidatus Methanofastidiosa archaeon]|nr:GHKL domain-containing protein [Candidatus Methanofastidiosa archaeon]
MNVEKRDTTISSKEKDDDLDKFVYMVSHDLRSPLAAIQGMVQLLNEDYRDVLGPEGEYYLERINVNVVKMESLINDLLKLSRVGRFELPNERIDVNSLVHKIVNEYLEQYGLDRRVIVVDELPSVFYPREALKDVFEYLIDNAFKFLGDQEEPRIRVGFQKKESHHIFFVKDNGIGISQENSEKIFKVFERVRDIDSKGNGMGLTLSKKIVEYYGGKIWVESTKGKGSTFFFTVPVAEAELNEI